MKKALNVVPTLGAVLRTMLRWDLLLAYRQRGDSVNPLVFALIVLPLYVPALIFGAGAVNAACQALPYGPQLTILTILAGLTLLALVLAPLAIVGALRINLDD